MGDILKKITQLLADGANYEERRSTGIIIKCGWFEAIDSKEDNVGSGAGQSKEVDRDGTEKRNWTPINDIPCKTVKNSV